MGKICHDESMKKYLWHLWVLWMPIFCWADNNSIRPIGKHTSSSVTKEAITPEAGPRVVNGVDLMIILDFLYWTARQEGCAIAQTGVGFVSDNLADTAAIATRGQTYYVPKKWQPGFRAGFGCNLWTDGWDSTLVYTWFYGNTHTHLNNNSPQVFAIWDLGMPYNLESSRFPWTHFFSTWSLHFNNFDFDLGRNYYISPELTLRNHIGLKGGWYQQNFYLLQNGIFADPEGLINPNLMGPVSMRQEQQFWWIGIRAGLDTAWHLNDQWSIVGDFALSGVWGRFDTIRKDNNSLRNTTSQPFSEITSMNTARKFNTLKSVIELLLGLQYDWWIVHDKLHFLVKTAWENQSWINQNNFVYLDNGDAARGDLIFQGLTLHVRFDF